MTQVIKQKEIENQQDKIIEIQKTNLKELKQIPFVDAAKLIYKKKLGEKFEVTLGYSLLDGNKTLNKIFARRVIRKGDYLTGYKNQIFIELEYNYANGMKNAYLLEKISDFIEGVNNGLWVILA